MGYMGLGMQKWIYTQRPRKPFSKLRKLSIVTDKRFAIDDLKVGGRTHKNPSKRDIKLVLERMGRTSLRNKLLNLLIAFAIILLTYVILIKYEPWKSTENTEQYLIQQQEKALQLKIENFNMSISYGKHYLNKGDFVLAKQEFHHALEVFPNNQETLEYLVKTYMQDCITNEVNCEKTLILLDKLIEKEPNNLEYLSYKISLENKKIE
jgi:cytochrome c-type biogenesis protein CcmH/NrfG